MNKSAAIHKITHIENRAQDVSSTIRTQFAQLANQANDHFQKFCNVAKRWFSQRSKQVLQSTQNDPRKWLAIATTVGFLAGVMLKHNNRK